MFTANHNKFLGGTPMKRVYMILSFLITCSLFAAPIKLTQNAPTTANLLETISNIGFHWKDEFYLETQDFEKHCLDNVISQKEAKDKMWALVLDAVKRSTQEYIGAEYNDEALTQEQVDKLPLDKAKEELFALLSKSTQYYSCKKSGEYYGYWEDYYFIAKDGNFRLMLFFGEPD
jgi:hypothetical protein